MMNENNSNESKLNQANQSSENTSIPTEEKEHPMRFHNFYIAFIGGIYPLFDIIRILVRVSNILDASSNPFRYDPFRSDLLRSAYYDPSILYFMVVLVISSVIFSIIVAFQLKKMTAAGYRLNQCLLIYQIFVFALTGVNALFPVVYSIPIFIYYAVRKDMFIHKRK